MKRPMTFDADADSSVMAVIEGIVPLETLEGRRIARKSEGSLQI